MLIKLTDPYNWSNKSCALLVTCERLGLISFFSNHSPLGEVSNVLTTASSALKTLVSNWCHPL